MKARHYAQAFFELSLASPERAEHFVHNLEKKLAAENKSGLLAAIGKELSRIISGIERKSTVTISGAGTADIAEAKQKLTEHANALNIHPHAKIAEETDPALIGGYRIETVERRVDKTYKRKLVELYETLLTQ